MKRSLYLLFAVLPFTGTGQTGSEEQLVLEKVQQFFTALEKQDTTLYKSVFLEDATGWAIRFRNDSVKYSTWRTADRVKRLINPAAVVEEKMIRYEIRIHNRIAMAWVPYTLSVSGKFSHCGVDLFTFLKTEDGWKINTCSFTVEPDGCAALRKDH